MVFGMLSQDTFAEPGFPFSLPGKTAEILNASPAVRANRAPAEPKSHAATAERRSERSIDDRPSNTVRTENFIVTASSPELARELANKAETLRKSLAEDWLGEELPPWNAPVRMDASCGDFAIGGRTSFRFMSNEPVGFQMQIQGCRERLLDSVLPHEILHTIFASHFGKPLPRWADEGACACEEAEVERGKYRELLAEMLPTGRKISFDKMVEMKEYPKNILSLYAQGHSVVEFLLHQKDKKTFVAFVEKGMKTSNWSAAVREFYGFRNLSDLEVKWRHALQLPTASDSKEKPPMAKPSERT